MINDVLFSNLKNLRKSHKLTQEEVANLIGKDRSLIAKYESGKAVPPINILNSFSKLYNISVDNLCNEAIIFNDKVSVTKINKKGKMSFSSLSDMEKDIILKLRLLDEDKLDEFCNILSKLK